MRIFFDTEDAKNKDIRLNGAVFLQQVRYWCEDNKKNNKQQFYKDNRWWVAMPDRRLIEDYCITTSVKRLKDIRDRLVNGGYLLAEEHTRGWWYSVIEQEDAPQQRASKGKSKGRDLSYMEDF